MEKKRSILYMYKMPIKCVRCLNILIRDHTKCRNAHCENAICTKCVHLTNRMKYTDSNPICSIKCMIPLITTTIH